MLVDGSVVKEVVDKVMSVLWQSGEHIPATRSCPGVETLISSKIRNLGFICAILVVLTHITRSVEGYGLLWYVFALGRETISKMAVPFFFLCSGYFLARHFSCVGWWPREMRKRITSLLVPFVIFNFLFFVWRILIAILKNICVGRTLFENVEIHNVVLEAGRLFGLILYETPPLWVTWYLRCLFLFVLISPLLCCIVKDKLPGLWFVVLTGLIWFGFQPWSVGPHTRMEVFFLYGFSLEGLFFFSAGLYLSLHYSDCLGSLPLSRKKWMVLMITLVFVGLRISTMKYEWCYSYYFARSVITLSLLLGFVFVPEGAWPKCLLSSTFSIYLMHSFVTVIATAVLGRTLHVSVFWYVVVFLVAVAIPIVVANLMHRHCPRIAKVLLGGR